MSRRLNLEISDELGEKLDRLLASLQAQAPGATLAGALEVVLRQGLQGTAVADPPEADDRPLAQCTMRELARALGIADMTEARRKAREALDHQSGMAADAAMALKHVQGLVKIYPLITITNAKGFATWAADMQNLWLETPALQIAMIAGFVERPPAPTQSGAGGAN